MPKKDGIASLKDKAPKIDLIVTWPSGMDYPTWRWFISHYHKLFNNIIVVFYPKGSLDFTRFLRSNFPEVKFLISDSIGQTWREDAVNTALNYSTADWVWFTEQDFLFKDLYCFERIFEAMKDHNVIGVKQGNRFHPCSLFVKRKIIDKTSKDFSAPKQDMDHFSIFSKEIESIGKPITFDRLALFKNKDWYHMSSLTWNYFRIMDDELEDMHEPANFLVWNYYSRKAAVPQAVPYIGLSKWAERKLSSFGEFIAE